MSVSITFSSLQTARRVLQVRCLLLVYAFRFTSKCITVYVRDSFSTSSLSGVRCLKSVNMSLLTLDKKYAIVKRLESGEKLAALSKEFNIGRSTIHDIRKKKNEIESFFKSNESSSNVRKTLKAGEFPQVEDALCLVYAREKPTHTHFR